MSTENDEALRERRERHIGRLLLQAHRAFNTRAIDELRARGHPGLGLAHTALLPHLDLAGTRTTTLAERTGMTKQGMGQLVLDLERQGYLTRQPDPADRRATLVRFTEEGWRFLRDAEAVKRELEAEYARVLGERGLARLRTALETLIEHERRRV